jgi:uncharacterized membrane protein YtjA (UPF0391 family)
MLYWSMVFLVLALVAATAGFGGWTITVPVDGAWVAFVVFLTLFLATLLAVGLERPRP